MKAYQMIRMLLGTALLALVSQPAVAQRPANEWSVLDIARALQSEAGIPEVEVRILATSARSPRSARADSLVDVLAKHAADNPSPKVRVRSALYLIAFSENGHPTAGERVVAIADHAREEPRTVVLRSAQRIRPVEAAIPWLRRVAVGGNGASEALVALGQLGEQGAGALRTLVCN